MKLTTTTQVSVDGVVQGNGARDENRIGGFELFAGYWGVRDDLENPIVGALNTKLKYVASNTLTEPRWANTTVLSGDVAAAIGELKAKPGGSCRCTAAAP